MSRVEVFLKRFVEAGGEVAEDLGALLEELKGLPVAVESSLKKRFPQLESVTPEEAEVSITRASAAAADTGSLLFGYTDQEDFKLVSLPRIHVALLSRRRIYAGLGTALLKVKGSYVSIVTGPSKTGDIELMHVFGVHGPERVVVVLEGR